MAINICLGCQTSTEIVVDHMAGHKLCSQCGLVLELKQVDEIPQWRNSPDDSVENGNQNPVAGIENPSTYTSKSIVKTPKKGLKLMTAMADRLGLLTTIKDRACEIYDMVDVLKTCRGRCMNSIVAACLYIACREIRSSRTLNEISNVAGGVSKKNINRTAEAIKKQLEVEAWTVQPGELVTRFCSKLGLENQAIKAVQEAVHRVEELDIRRSPKSILAAIIYMVIQLCHDQAPPLPVKEIAVAMEVTELTIRKCYKDIFVYATRVIPDWYAGEDDIKKIPIP